MLAGRFRREMGNCGLCPAGLPPWFLRGTQQTPPRALPRTCFGEVVQSARWGSGRSHALGARGVFGCLAFCPNYRKSKRVPLLGFMGDFPSLALLDTFLLILVTQNRPKIPGKTKRIPLGGFPYFGAKKLPVCPKINDFFQFPL